MKVLTIMFYTITTMRTTLGKYFVFAAFVMATMVGCMKDDFEDINLVGDVTFTAKVNLDIGNGSKQLSENGVKTFAAGEQIAVVYINTSDHTVKATSVALTAGDITNNGKSATFTVTLTDPKAGTTVKYVYPASMVDNNGNETAIANQDGTLESLSSLYDYAYGEGSFDGSALPRLTLTNQFAIGKITMKNYAGSSTLSYIKGATITDGTNTYTITPASSEFSWPIYVAMKPVSSDKTITINATDEGTRDYDTYTKFVTGKTLYAGKMYTLTVKMRRVVELSHLSHYTGSTDYYTSQNGDVLTGTLQEGSYYRQIIIGAGDTVTLAGVNINSTNSESYNWAGITCYGDATLILKEGTTNTVKGFKGSYPGIRVGEGYTLTIMGGGSLNASSNNASDNGTGAGIGGIGATLNGEFGSAACGNINIKGGIITATGGVGAAGIGGGRNGACGNITISGGNVTASCGGNYSAGIGGAYQGNCGNITITGGIVCATGASGFGGVGIGGGYEASCGDITITSGVTFVSATNTSSAVPSIGAGFRGTCGTVTIGGTVNPDGIRESHYTYPAGVTNLATITENTTFSDGAILSGILGANVKISIAAGATVTLRDVTINGIASGYSYPWAGINCEGNATLILKGTNKVKGFHSCYPGIHVTEGSTLTIRGDGSLTASSNGSGAGIGSGRHGHLNLSPFDVPCGNINIEGGTITATGGTYAAGIGAASRSSCGNITISGGTITATGGKRAPGIGSGSFDYMEVESSSCGNITISGAHVTATKGRESPNSIGKGSGASCGTVTIGGIVYPDGISESPYTYEP